MIKHGQEVIDGLDRIVTATEKAAARAFWIATPTIWETVEARADPFEYRLHTVCPADTIPLCEVLVRFAEARRL